MPWPDLFSRPIIQKSELWPYIIISGLNIAYGQTNYPSNGPFPRAVVFSGTEDVITATVEFDQVSKIS
jgi:hypothetical protein